MKKKERISLVTKKGNKVFAMSQTQVAKAIADSIRGKTEKKMSDKDIAVLMDVKAEFIIELENTDPRELNRKQYTKERRVNINDFINYMVAVDLLGKDLKYA